MIFFYVFRYKSNPNNWMVSYTIKSSFTAFKATLNTWNNDYLDMDIFFVPTQCVRRIYGNDFVDKCNTPTNLSGPYNWTGVKPRE